MTTQMGRYELGPLLGEGGEGRVYRATLEGPGGFSREVALKVLAQHGERLRREARLGGLLRHPNLVDVYEVGESEGTWFASMELCPGGSLADRGRLPPRAVVDVGLQVCDALAYAHRELGLVHLDLKPENLLLVGSQVKVADLGIARARGFVDGDRVRGTPGYMAPEQRRGGAVDARTDVYGLGVVLIELATGAHQGASQTWVDDSEPIFQALDAVTWVPWLEAVVVRCVAEDPADRFDDMEAVAAALLDLEVPGPDLATFLGHEVAEAPVRIAADPADRFIGRSIELARLLELVESEGLWTLKGPGGVGKSRLAREIVAGYAASGRPAILVDTTAASTSMGLLSVIAGALELAPQSEPVDVTIARIGRGLAARTAPLLVLDGFEHLVAHADIVAAIAVGSRVLITSQAPLGLPEETVFGVGPLPPAEAVELLQARASQRGVEPPVDELSMLAARLDGLPLALELAAGRLGVLSVADVLERLNLSLLRSARTGRHSTLEATLAWSVQLLSDAERQMLAHLSVFHGGFSVEAADAIAGTGASASTLQLLQALLDRSLLARDGERLTMLSAVRQFAARLAPIDGAELRHATWFAELPVEVDAWLDLENLAVAVRWAVAIGEPGLAVALLRRLHRPIADHGPFALGIELADAVLGLASDDPEATVLAAGLHVLAGDLDHGRTLLDRTQAGGPAVRAMAEALLGRIAVTQGDGVRAWSHARRALRLLEQLPPRATLDTIERVGWVLQKLGRHSEATRVYERRQTIARALGMPSTEAAALADLGAVMLSQGQTADALPLLEEASRREAAPVRHATVLGNLAIALKDAGELDRARACMEQSIELYRRLDDRGAQARIMGNLAVLLRQLGEIEEAARQVRGCLELQKELGDRRGEAINMGFLASLLSDKGAMASARAQWMMALELHERAGNRHFHSVVLANLGFHDVMEGAVEGGMHQLEEAVMAFEELENETWAAVCRGLLGRAAAHVGDDERAEAELSVAADRLREHHAEAGPLFAAVLAEVRHRRGDPTAHAVVDAAVEALRDHGFRQSLADTLGLRARICHRDGDVQGAAAALSEGDEVLRVMGLGDCRAANTLRTTRAELGL